VSFARLNALELQTVGDAQKLVDVSFDDDHVAAVDKVEDWKRPGVIVMITIFGRFSQFSEKGVFLGNPTA
jgi:hypothetical protein